MNASQKRDLADQIRDAIDRSGRSQVDLCRAADIDASSMSKFMSGRRGLSLAALERVAAALDLHVVVTGKP